ncbi:MAG TPA: hypothetical protein EYH32_04935 [Anaerolineae bacterium]|nr:hypothetical protein [Anaerolineae bacterium]
MTCVLVLGPHRSGTSAVAGVLHHLGVVMGERLLGPGRGNERGHYEDAEFLALHERIIGDWHNPPGPNTLSERYASARGEYERLVRVRNERYRLWGIKDPRLCILLPIVLPAFDGVELKIVSVHRLLSLSAASLSARDGLSYVDALKITIRYNDARHAVLRTVADLPICHIDYDRLVNSPWSNVVSLAQFVGVGPRAEAAAFVDPSLRHFSVQDLGRK